MAWTAPITWTSGTTLTAAQLNTLLRDNLLEQAPAKATETGSYFAVSGTNTIAERVPVFDEVSAAQSTSSGSYVNLSTTGPSVTTDTGSHAFVITSTRIENNTSDFQSHYSWAISGATTRAASDSTAVTTDGITGGNFCRLTAVDLLSDLTAGSNTFTAKYRVGGGTGTYADRRITVWPF